MCRLYPNSKCISTTMSICTCTTVCRLYPNNACLNTTVCRLYPNNACLNTTVCKLYPNNTCLSTTVSQDVGRGVVMLALLGEHGEEWTHATVKSMKQRVFGINKPSNTLKTLVPLHLTLVTPAFHRLMSLSQKKTGN